MNEAAPLPWQDDLLVAQLRLIAHSAADVTGYGVAEIRVADEDGQLHLAAREGAHADRTPETVEHYPLNDRDGRLIGTLDFALPPEGARSGKGGQVPIHRYATQAGDAILLALDRHRAAEEARHAQTVRDLVRSAMSDLTDGADLEAALGRVADVMMAHFQLAGLWFMISGDAEARLPDVRRGHVPDRTVVPVDDKGGLATRLWRQQEVALLTLDQQLHLEEADERIIAAAREFLVQAGYASQASAPLCTETMFIGPIRAWRAIGAPRWSEIELDTLGEIGREVGQVLAAALADQRDQELIADLRALNAYKSDMVSTVSHELKNPLAALLTNLEMLDDPQPSGADRRQVLGAIARSTQRMTRIIDDLLLLGSEGEAEHGPLDLVPLVREVCEAAGDAAALRGQQIVLRAPARPVMVSGDATELDRLTMNLVSNAIKYSPSGTRIRVTLQRDGSDAVLSVVDQGIGIAPPDQQRIFGEFVRSTDPDALAAPGTGLGLAIVQRIVERHQGSIEVESEPGEGSTFRVRIAVRDDDGGR